MFRRRVKSVDGRTLRSKDSLKSLKCSTEKCEREVKVDKDTVSVLCWECAQRNIGVDSRLLRQHTDRTQAAEMGFPRGWKFYKQFVHADGRVFERGVEMVELKGTLPPTVVKVNTLTRTQRRRLREEKKARREKRLARQYERKVENQNKEQEVLAEVVHE